MIYDLDENILIYNLIDKIPIIKNLLLAESCRFFNNIVYHNIEYKNTKQFCLKLKKNIQISIIEKSNTLSILKKIKHFNILIGQIKLFYLEGILYIFWSRILPIPPLNIIGFKYSILLCLKWNHCLLLNI